MFTLGYSKRIINNRRPVRNVGTQMFKVARERRIASGAHWPFWARGQQRVAVARVAPSAHRSFWTRGQQRAAVARVAPRTHWPFWARGQQRAEAARVAAARVAAARAAAARAAAAADILSPLHLDLDEKTVDVREWKWLSAEVQV
jgi:hypothetical protein